MSGRLPGTRLNQRPSGSVCLEGGLKAHTTHAGSAMQVRLLGPIDVLVKDEPREVHGQRRKAVLAVLAMQRGEVVSTNQLVDVVWGDAPPPTALNALQSHVSYL